MEDRYEAGIALQGLEVKSLREGRVQIKESYITIKDKGNYSAHSAMADQIRLHASS
ncbi:MAG: SsrA-binding protein [Candidatus Thiodiazotropha sp. (ex Lucinoma aequizonata)]|nr:SsrA-binding protein [Candidatus Thiodiazotropha sp. (ex Lucinoma aequizonata)]